MLLFNPRRFLKMQRGFSLVELLISMAIFAVVMGIVYTYLLKTKTQLTTSESELEAANNAQKALNALRNDLYMIGSGRDVDHDQPRLLRCAPYEIVFVADLDRDISDTTDRYGSYVNSLGGASGADFTPIRDLITTPLSNPSNFWGWDPSTDYGSQYLGAEIVRYSLDYNTDGIVNQLDTEDSIAASDPELTHNANPADFWLIKEWWGSVTDAGAGGFRNAYSGVHPIAFNIHGNIYDRVHPGGYDRSPFIYPNGEWPQVIFTYWGHFINNVTPHDDPTDPLWEGEPLDLWGDWGGGAPPGTLPAKPISGNPVGDGKLDSAEIQFLLENTSGWGQVSLATLNGGSGENPGEDINMNGISGENRLDQIVRRIGITIIAESGSPDYKNPNTARSNFSTDPPQIYPFHDYEVSITINPQNLVYTGAPQVVVTPFTPTPIPFTPTPAPPPPTQIPGSPTYTPTTTPTPLPGTTYTPTPTPHSIWSYKNDEIIVGSTGSIVAVSMKYDEVSVPDICDTASTYTYWLPHYSTVIDMEAVNFCDPPYSPDRWNDLVFITDDSQYENLYFMHHRAYSGIDGFEFKDSIRVGNSIGSQISAMAIGNIGSVGTGDAAYPEILVAYYDPSTTTSYIEIYYINAQCGNLIRATCSPYILNNVQVTDMVMADFDGDNLDELVVTTNDISGNPQLIVLDDLAGCISGSWNVILEIPNLFLSSSEYPIQVTTGSIFSTSPGNDIAVVSNIGRLFLIQHSGGGSFVLPACDPSISAAYELVNYSPPSEMITYLPTSSSEPFDRISIIGINNSDYHISTYSMNSPSDCGQCYILSNCSGLIYPTPTPPGTPDEIYPLDVIFTEFNRTAMLPVLIISYSRNSSEYELALIKNPCDQPILNEICRISLPLSSPPSAITSTKNAHSNEIN